MSLPEPPAPPGQPYPAPPMHAHPRNNGLATASMVLGLVGLITFPLVAIPPILAVIFGLVARGQIRASNGLQVGDGMAVAGIVLGVLEMVIFVLLLVAGHGSFSIHFG